MRTRAGASNALLTSPGGIEARFYLGWAAIFCMAKPPLGYILRTSVRWLVH
jgi:hypothetical protein